MTPILIVHISAGAIAIACGAAALTVRKGARPHRLFGALFVVAILTMAATATYMAVAIPPRPGAAFVTPPKAMVSVAILASYLTATAWMTVRRRSSGVGGLDYAAMLVASGVAVAMLVFGLQAAGGPAGTIVTPYFVFAAFAALPAGLDMTVILRRGLSGPQRIARHVWRMCLALIFATAFFFIFQQKVMPTAWRGAPMLYAPTLAVLAAMIFWLIRIWFTKAFRPATPA